jgi:multidrug efflux pump subunit AcrA (membrane-fusion protein)
MCPDAPPHDRPTADLTLREIDRLVEEIAGLSKASLAPNEFYGQFLSRVLAGLAAPGGIIWAQDPSGEIRAVCRSGRADESGGVDERCLAWHRRCAASALEGQSGIAVPPRSSVPADNRDLNPTDSLLLFCPWKSEGGAAGVVEIVQRPGAGPDLVRGYLRFLEVACELATEYERNSLLRDLRVRAAQWGQLEEFSARVHGDLNLAATAYTIANESRRILQCDRVSVLVRRGSKYRVAAISGTDTFSRRSSSVRLLERLTGAALATGDALWYPSPSEERFPQIEKRLEPYVDESHVRGLAILPLRGDTAPNAAGTGIQGGLAVECFSSMLDEPLRKTALALCRHSGLAIRNALELERLPLRRVSQALGKVAGGLRGKRLALAGLALVAIVVAVAAMVFIPADFTVEARGELQPLLSRDIFAPNDGIVHEVRVQSGAPVAANQVLLFLRKPELDLEFKRVEGELQTARKRLASVESEQLVNRREDETQRKRYTELTAQQEELRALVASLEAQHAILQQQQSDLEVRSPIAGELLTWNAEQLLEARPVVRGQVLLTVADLAGPWGLELRVPDRRVSHLVEARDRCRVPLKVSFALATRPAQVLWGELDRVGVRTEVTEAEGAVVLATVRIDREEIPELVPGAGVVARIQCGRRAIGYVWLHDLIDAVRAWLMF